MHKFTVRRVFSLTLAAGICLLTLLPVGAYASADSPIRPVEGTVPIEQSIRPPVCPIQDTVPDTAQTVQPPPAVVQDTPPGASPAAPSPHAVIQDAPPGSPTVQSPAQVTKPAVMPADGGSPVQPQPAEEPENTPESAPAPPAPAQTEGITTLLSSYQLTDTQRTALRTRLETETQTQKLLEQGELTNADLTYLALSNGRTDRLDRYSAWKEQHPEATPEEVVLQVNLDQDRTFYQNIQAAANQDSLTVLVNKHFALSADYVPVLETLGASYGTGSLRPEAAAAFRAMADAARSDGISLRSVSAYRSYQYQKSLYNRYLSQDRQASVDTYSARPGHSEHQTGLALDINVASMKAGFERTPAYAWLQEHCAEYGFMLRYPKGKEHITGYSFEPWHYRYVGTEIAKACMEQGLTYEEYLALQPETVFLLQAASNVEQ